jgi:Erv1 / Alr family
MTSLWGPMGWMTLHSISLLYPEVPTASDKQILRGFLNEFAESITCPHCERHFKTMFDNYRFAHPEWANSRFDLFLFVARAHNTVNRRLEKPLKNTVQECLDAIASASQYTSLTEFRKKYIDYVIQRMSFELSGDNMVKVGYAKNMKRTNETYWNSKVTTDTSTFDMNANVLEFIKDEASTHRLMFSGSGRENLTTVSGGPNMSIGFRGGRLRLNVR